MRLLVLTDNNFIPFAQKELSLILNKKAAQDPLLDDSLLIDIDDITEASVILSLFSEMAKLFCLELGRWDISNIQESYYKAMEIPWDEYWTPNLTFAVRPQVRDQELLKNLGKHIGQAIVDTFLQNKKNKPRVNLSNPEIEVYVWYKENSLILALNLCGPPLNTPEEIIARGLVLASEWDFKKNFGEILYAGSSLSAFRLASWEARRERISSRAFIRLNIIDKEKIIELLRKSWRKNHAKVTCYERRNKIPILREEEPEIRRINLKTIEELGDADEEVLVTNFLFALEKKKEQKEWAEKISEILKHNNNWQRVLILIREDLADNFILEGKLWEKSITLKGIKTKIVNYSR